MLPAPIELQGLQALEGKEVGVSEWRTVDQSSIDMFAALTDDHQFIHVDPIKAADTPFGGTIAHGFLTLSMLVTFANEVVPALVSKILSVNRGFDRIRFVTPVRSGSRIRGRFKLAELELRPKEGWVACGYDVTIEIEGSEKPALVARWLTMARIQPWEQDRSAPPRRR
jgi:acyl dehydratase